MFLRVVSERVCSGSGFCFLDLYCRGGKPGFRVFESERVERREGFGFWRWGLLNGSEKWPGVECVENCPGFISRFQGLKQPGVRALLFGSFKRVVRRFKGREVEG